MQVENPPQPGYAPAQHPAPTLQTPLSGAPTGNNTNARKLQQLPERPKIHTFRYKLATAHDIKLKGKVRAATPEQALGIINQPGANLASLKKSSEFFSMQVGGGRVSTQELILFARQMAAFIRAGIPMIEALGSVGGEHASRKMQDTCREIALDLQEGMALSRTLVKHNSVFPDFVIDLVRAGEITGNLDSVLDKAADYLERQHEAKKKIRSALAYPAVIALVALLTVVVLVTWVLPRFVTFFDQFDAKLPLPTRMLMAANDWVRDNWFVLIVVLLAFLMLLIVLLMTEAGQRLKDGLLLRVPALGVVIRFSIIERFCHTLSTLVQAGVPLVETFTVLIDGSGNRLFQRGLARVQEQMMTGQGMSGPIAATGLFPGNVSQMIKVGEETGTLENQLQIAADLYSKELDFRLKKFTAVFEPLVIVFMGGIVGFVALALVSAMYGIFSQVGG